MKFRFPLCWAEALGELLSFSFRALSYLALSTGCLIILTRSTVIIYMDISFCLSLSLFFLALILRSYEISLFFFVLDRGQKFHFCLPERAQGVISVFRRRRAGYQEDEFCSMVPNNI